MWGKFIVLPETKSFFKVSFFCGYQVSAVAKGIREKFYSTIIIRKKIYPCFSDYNRVSYYNILTCKINVVYDDTQPIFHGTFFFNGYYKSVIFQISRITIHPILLFLDTLARIKYKKVIFSSIFVKLPTTQGFYPTFEILRSPTDGVGLRGKKKRNDFISLI